MTNTTIDLTPVLEGIISLVIAIFSIIIIPKFRAWLGTKLTASQIEIAKTIIKTLVNAAEQIYANTSKSGIF